MELLDERLSSSAPEVGMRSSTATVLYIVVMIAAIR